MRGWSATKTVQLLGDIPRRHKPSEYKYAYVITEYCAEYVQSTPYCTPYIRISSKMTCARVWNPNNSLLLPRRGNAGRVIASGRVNAPRYSVLVYA